jgi:NitT/TauT family transport system substrate-binding protein
MGNTGENSVSRRLFMGVCAIAFTGFAGASAQAAATKIRVMVYNGAYTSLPVHVANDMGFYAKNGLDAETVTVNSGPAGVAALLGGSIDFVEPPTDQIMENVIKGTDLKIVVGNETKNFYTLVAADKSKFPDLDKGYPAVVKDMKGMRIGVNALGASTQLMMNAMLKDAGLSPDDVTYVAVGSATTALAAWEAKRIDVQVAFTPFPEIVEALGSGFPVVDLSKGQGPEILQKLGNAFEGFSAKGSFIKEHPGVVAGFIKAQSEAIEWMKDPANHDKLADLVKKYVNVSIVPADARDKTVDLMIKNYTGYLGYTVDPAAIDAWNTYLLDNKLISRPVKADEVIYSGAPKP